MGFKDLERRIRASRKKSGPEEEKQEQPALTAVDNKDSDSAPE